jgi:endonuclease YncB( thermonuclease family)
MSRPRSIAPHHRGLISAVATFALLLFVGVGWVIWANRIPALDREPTTYVPTPYATEGSGVPLSRVDEQTLGHQAQGALVGVPTVIGGDTIVIDGVRYRFWGVRAFSGYSHCGPNPYGWACGTQPADALHAFTNGYLVACFDRGTGIDGQPVGQCMRGLLDVGGFMVSSGMATTVPQETRSYQLKLEVAKSGDQGIWSTE